MADLSQQLQSMNPEYEAEIAKYTDELKSQAKGNYDFIVKYLKQAHTQALGTDDSAKAQFLEQVANSVESSVGRIPFDYDTKTTREKEDIANYLKRSEIQKQNLNAQEKNFNAQQDFASQQEQQQNAQSANSRGLLGSGIQDTAAKKLQVARQLTQIDPFNTQLANSRATLGQQDAEALTQSQRNIEDITTGARRDAQDADTTLNQGTEGAGINLNNSNISADQQASSARQQAISLLAQQQAASAASGAANAQSDYYKSLLQPVS